MNLQINKKYKIKTPRGNGIILVEKILEDAEGELVDCKIIEGEFPTTIKGINKVRKENDYLCVRPDSCKWELYSSFN